MSPPEYNNQADMPEKETADAYHLEKHGSVLADGDSNEDNGSAFTVEQERAIIKRIDRRLVLTVGALYCVSLMDRVNMSAANIAGMAKELELTGYRYVSKKTALSIASFFSIQSNANCG